LIVGAYAIGILAIIGYFLRIPAKCATCSR